MDQNEKNMFQHDIEVPPIVMEKAQAAFLTIEEEGWDTMKEKKGVKTGRHVKFAAAAAALALLAAAGIAGNGVLAGQEDLSVARNDAQDDMPAEPADFSLTVYSQEMRFAGGQDGSLVLTDIGQGSGGYTGMLFRVQGDDIADVNISVDKGELYTTTMEEMPGDVYYELAAEGLPDEDGDPDTHTLFGDFVFEDGDTSQPPAKVIAYHCAKSGTQVAGKYDEELYYGFYIPDDVASSEWDLAAAYHERLGIFDGAVLAVDITRTDGSSVTKEYGLTVAKLALDENRNVTQQEWIEGGEGYVYGILAKEK